MAHAVLNRIEDPRDNLAKCTRDEIWDYARFKGADIYFPQGADTPRDDMIQILRNKGHIDIIYTPRVIGMPPTPSPYTRKEPLPAVKREEPRHESVFDLATATRAEMAKECKRRGIKMARTDTMEKLRERLSVQDAA